LPISTSEFGLTVLIEAICIRHAQRGIHRPRKTDPGPDRLPRGGGAGAVFGPQPLAAPDFSPLFTGNFRQAVGPFLRRGVISNITGFLSDTSPPVDAVDQETAAAQQAADADNAAIVAEAFLRSWDDAETTCVHRRR
jgi:hypothetical protein